MNAERTQRVFFALWPDEVIRAALVQATRPAVLASGGRLVPAENLHVTLLFIGSVPQARLPDVQAMAQEIARAARATEVAPDLIFDAVEFWKKPRLLVATTSDSSTGSRVAEDLARGLESEARRCGFVPDLDASGLAPMKFRPHVTLARDVQRPKSTPNLSPVTWKFKEFALVESRTGPQGSVYTVLQTFRIGNRSAGGNN